MKRYIESNSTCQRDYYRERYPQEVIVIEDSPPPMISTTYNRKRSYNDTNDPIKRRKGINSNNCRHVVSIQSQKTSTYVAEPWDDKEGHYIIRPNELLSPQYQIVKLLGQGTFGKVVECYDKVRRTHCAVKVIRAIPKYRDASKIEIAILNTLKKHDPLNMYQCIHLIEWFEYKNHICMVFELLSLSLFDTLKLNQFKPFPMHQIQQLSKQLLTSVTFLHDLKLIHTDLKPENILLVDPVSQTPSYHDSTHTTLESTHIRLIDFGSATFNKSFHSAIVSTRHYRAPEIILGTGWSYPCDLWSIGCIILEFYMGDALFQTNENKEHLAMIESILGPMPVSMISKASKEIQKCYKNNRLKYPTSKTSRQSKQCVSALKPLEKLICSNSTPSVYETYLIDLLSKILVYEPDKRISAREALRHPYFQLSIE